MARGKHRVRRPPEVPLRELRIGQLRESEQRMRDALDRALQLGKRLSDLMLYDKLAKDAAARLAPLTARLHQLVAQRLHVVEQCFLANYELQREVDRLQQEMDRRSGKQLPPSLLERMESMLKELTDEQANAIRFIARRSAQE